MSHEGKADLHPQALGLELGLLDARLELLLGDLEVADVHRGAVEEGDLGRLLVARRKDLLELAVALAQLVAAALFTLDALAADILLATAAGLGGITEGEAVGSVVVTEVIVRVEVVSVTGRAATRCCLCRQTARGAAGAATADRLTALDELRDGLGGLGATRAGVLGRRREAILGAGVNRGSGHVRRNGIDGSERTLRLARSWRGRGGAVTIVASVAAKVCGAREVKRAECERRRCLCEEKEV